jgi:hypothetical protein
MLRHSSRLLPGETEEESEEPQYSWWLDRDSNRTSPHEYVEMLHPEPFLAVKHLKSHTTMDCSVRTTVFGFDLFCGMTVVIDSNVSISNFLHRINLTRNWNFKINCNVQQTVKVLTRWVAFIWLSRWSVRPQGKMHPGNYCLLLLCEVCEENFSLL